MSNHDDKQVGRVGSSSLGTGDAIRQAIDTAATTLRPSDWFELPGTRGRVVEARMARFQVSLKVGFRLEA